MLRTLLSGKIHRAVVTHADLYYVGSITIDTSLMTAAGMLPGERVQVLNLNEPGHRIETYIIPGEADSGVIGINGAAAHQFTVADKVIILSYAQLTDTEIHDHRPRVVFVDDHNAPIETGVDSAHTPAETGLIRGDTAAPRTPVHLCEETPHHDHT